MGPTDALWHGLIAELKRDLTLDAEEWNSSSVKAGWLLRLQRKQRNIVYLGPRMGWFRASFVLGDKAIAAVAEEQASTAVLKIIDQAKRYPEGTAVRIEVHKAKDADVAKTLAKITLEN